jgi:predicted secreted Zn-dependent protease
MRRAGCAILFAVAAGLAAGGSAEASVKTKTKTTTYRISGKSGNQLLDAMDHRGPKHGLLTRAIAQTAYAVSWEIDWRERNGQCRIASADAELTITYNYPQVANAMSADLKRRWERFMSGVRKHEQTHGRLAREMANAAEKQILRISFKNDRGCRRTQAEVKRRINAIYAAYEARQVEFDGVEHAEGGNVERLVNQLSRGK